MRSDKFQMVAQTLTSKFQLHSEVVNVKIL